MPVRPGRKAPPPPARPRPCPAVSGDVLGGGRGRRRFPVPGQRVSGAGGAAGPPLCRREGVAARAGRGADAPVTGRGVRGGQAAPPVRPGLSPLSPGEPPGHCPAAVPPREGSGCRRGSVWAPGVPGAGLGVSGNIPPQGKAEPLRGPEQRTRCFHFTQERVGSPQSAALGLFTPRWLLPARSQGSTGVVSVWSSSRVLYP